MTKLKGGHRVAFVDGRDGPARMRVGKVWSEAPGASTYWVLPDDEPTKPVAVKVPPQSQTDKGVMPSAVAMVSQADQALTMRRVQALNRVAMLIGTTSSEQPTLDGASPVTFHADDGCELAAGRGIARAYRHGRPNTLATHKATDILTGKAQARFTLCRRCVYLEEQ